MSMTEDRSNGRVDNVKRMASNLAKFGEGFSVREFLDALALASGSLIKVVYRKSGQEVAIASFVEELRRAANKK